MLYMANTLPLQSGTHYVKVAQKILNHIYLSYKLHLTHMSNVQCVKTATDKDMTLHSRVCSNSYSMLYNIIATD